MSFNFWYRWIITVSFVVFVCGLITIISNYTSAFETTVTPQLNLIFFNTPIVSPEITDFQRFALDLVGAWMVGWGVMMVYVASTGFRRQEQWAWYSFTWSIVLWFLCGTAVSLYHKVYGNAYANVVLLLLFMIPLIFSKKYFFHWSRI